MTSTGDLETTMHESMNPSSALAFLQASRPSLSHLFAADEYRAGSLSATDTLPADTGICVGALHGSGFCPAQRAAGQPVMTDPECKNSMTPPTRLRPTDPCLHRHPVSASASSVCTHSIHTWHRGTLCCLWRHLAALRMWTQASDVLVVLIITATACWLAVHQRRRVAALFSAPGTHHSKAPEGLFLAWDIAQQHKGPEHLYSGHLASPQALLCLRLTHVAVFAGTVVYLLLVTQPGSWWLVWFTNWTFTGYGVYGVLSSALTAHYWRRQVLSRGGDDSNHGRRTALDVRHPGRWHSQDRAVGVLLEVLCTTSIAVSVFYWTIYALCLQYCGSVGFDNAMEHGTSALLLLLDIGLSRAPINSFHLAVPVLYGCLYLIFHTIYALVSGNWVYTVLAWQEPLSLVFYAALPLVLMLAFCIMLCVAVVRERTGPWLANHLLGQPAGLCQPYLPLSSNSPTENGGIYSDTTLPGLGHAVGSGWSRSGQGGSLAVQVVKLGSSTM